MNPSQLGRVFTAFPVPAPRPLQWEGGWWQEGHSAVQWASIPRAWEYLMRMQMSGQPQPELLGLKVQEEAGESASFKVPSISKIAWFRGCISNAARKRNPISKSAFSQKLSEWWCLYDWQTAGNCFINYCREFPTVGVSHHHSRLINISWSRSA